MKKETERKKLVLSKQTLKLLNSDDLAKVKGARADLTNDGICGQISIGGCRTLGTDFCN